MKNIKNLLIAVLSFTALSVNAQLLSKGVTKELADQRKANISNVIYDLTFNIPASLQEKVTGKNIITFDLKEKQDVILDFQGEFNGTVYYYIKKGKKEKRKVTVAAYQLGRTSGLELCREILQIRPRTNVIYLTAFREYAFDAWGTGACGFLLKPLETETVRAQLSCLRYPVKGLL